MKTVEERLERIENKLGINDSPIEVCREPTSKRLTRFNDDGELIVGVELGKWGKTVILMWSRFPFPTEKSVLFKHKGYKIYSPVVKGLPNLPVIKISLPSQSAAGDFFKTLQLKLASSIGELVQKYRRKHEA